MRSQQQAHYIAGHRLKTQKSWLDAVLRANARQTFQSQMYESLFKNEQQAVLYKHEGLPRIETKMS